MSKTAITSKRESIINDSERLLKIRHQVHLRTLYAIKAGHSLTWTHLNAAYDALTLAVQAEESGVQL